MFCYNCGKQIDDKAVFCVHCGVQVAKFVSGNGIYSQNDNKVSGFTIAGFILSFFGWLAILGLIFCGIGFHRSSSNQNNVNKGISIAGIVISSLDLICFTIGMSIVIASCVYY